LKRKKAGNKYPAERRHRKTKNYEKPSTKLMQNKKERNMKHLIFTITIVCLLASTETTARPKKGEVELGIGHSIKRDDFTPNQTTTRTYEWFAPSGHKLYQMSTTTTGKMEYRLETSSTFFSASYGITDRWLGNVGIGISKLNPEEESTENSPNVSLGVNYRFYEKGPLSFAIGGTYGRASWNGKMERVITSHCIPEIRMEGNSSVESTEVNLNLLATYEISEKISVCFGPFLKHTDIEISNKMSGSVRSGPLTILRTESEASSIDEWRAGVSGGINLNIIKNTTFKVGGYIGQDSEGVTVTLSSKF
jgi:hypothetical protein